MPVDMTISVVRGTCVKHDMRVRALMARRLLSGGYSFKSTVSYIKLRSS